MLHLPIYIYTKQDAIYHLQMQSRPALPDLFLFLYNDLCYLVVLFSVWLDFSRYSWYDSLDFVRVTKCVHECSTMLIIVVKKVETIDDYLSRYSSPQKIKGQIIIYSTNIATFCFPSLFFFSLSFQNRLLSHLISSVTNLC